MWARTRVQGLLGRGGGRYFYGIEWRKHEHRVYWYCQLSGWGVVGLYWAYYSIGSVGYRAIPILLMQVAWQIGATHLYARTAVARRWTDLSLPRLLPIAAVAWLVLLLQYMAMSWINYRLICNCDGGYLNVVPGALSGGLRYLAIWLLAFHGYHLARQGALHAAEAARQAQLATEAQLAKLTGELNPHFLFNALNSIKALTREDPRRARTAIDHLAALLRQSLRQGEQDNITLAEEVGLVKEYLALEQLRFEERLLVDWKLPLQSDVWRLPPLSLHTLVENAVKHGIAHRPGGGRISITVRTSSDHWTVEVLNDGCHTTGATGTGLTNLRQRLDLRYGGSASITLAPVMDVNFPQVRATLKLPH